MILATGKISHFNLFTGYGPTSQQLSDKDITEYGVI